MKTEAGEYVVRCWTKQSGETQRLTFSGPMEACAAFIKRRVEEVRRRHATKT